MTQMHYTPRVGQHVVLLKQDKKEPLTITGYIHSVVEHSQYGFSIKFTGLDGYINIDKDTIVTEVPA